MESDCTLQMDMDIDMDKDTDIDNDFVYGFPVENEPLVSTL